MEPVLLMSALSGSRLHGTLGAGSDNDTRGVCAMPMTWLLGVGSGHGEVGRQVVGGGDDGLVQSLQVFARSLAKDSPGAWELLCTGPEYWQSHTVQWEWFYGLRFRWVSQVTLLVHNKASVNMFEAAQRQGDWKSMALAMRYAYQGMCLVREPLGYSPRLEGAELALLRSVRGQAGSMAETASELARYRAALDEWNEAAAQYRSRLSERMDVAALSDVVSRVQLEACRSELTRLGVR